MTIATATAQLATALTNTIGAPAPAGSTGLASKAMLVDLTIKSWAPTKADKRIVQASAIANQHSESVATGRKRLTESALVLAVETAKREAYAENRRRTLPWLDTGTRILGMAGYWEYQQAISERRRAFEDARDAVYAGWGAIVADARYGGLGGLFDPGQYPDLAKLQTRYAFDTRIIPLPDAEDFRVALGDSEVLRIRAELQGGLDTAVAVAMRDPWERISESLGRMVAGLRDYTGGRDGAFRDTLIGNVRDLVDVLPSLNITGDPDLTDVCQKLRVLAAGSEPGELRRSEALRRDVASEADAILARVTGILS